MKHVPWSCCSARVFESPHQSIAHFPTRKWTKWRLSRSLLIVLVNVGGTLQNYTISIWHARSLFLNPHNWTHQASISSAKPSRIAISRLKREISAKRLCLSNLSWRLRGTPWQKINPEECKFCKIPRHTAPTTGTVIAFPAAQSCCCLMHSPKLKFKTTVKIWEVFGNTRHEPTEQLPRGILPSKP